MMRTIVLLALFCALSACRGLYISHAPLTEREFQNISNPPARDAAKIEAAIPNAVAFSHRVEGDALRNGRPLNALELSDARAVGVRHPENIRVWITDGINVGRPSLLSEVGAMTVGYGIYVLHKYARNPSHYRAIMAHEMAHVAQFEELGREGMVRRLLTEKYFLPNKLIPIEREAILRGEAVYEDPDIKYGF